MGVKRELAGSIAGLLATAPMTVAMTAMHRALPHEDKEPLPPRQITDNAAALRESISDRMKTPVRRQRSRAHFGYGAAAGALTGRLPDQPDCRVRRRHVVWDGGVGRELSRTTAGSGLYRSAKDEPRSRNAMMISAHLIWGASLGLLVSAVSKDDN